MLAFEVAASALSPRKRPTQIELIEPFNDWRMFEASVGSANASNVDPIGPVVRSRRPLGLPRGGFAKIVPLNGYIGRLSIKLVRPPDT